MWHQNGTCFTFLGMLMEEKQKCPGLSWADPLKRGVISFPLVVVMTIRRHVVERDFAKAKFNYYILDLYNPKWEMIFR